MKSLLLAFAALSCFAQTIDRTKPPETPPLQPYKLPAAKETTLPNGLTVLTVTDPRFPLVTLRFAFRAGDRFDPAKKDGLGETMMELLKAGTAKRTSRQLAEELATVGAEIGTASAPDSFTISGNVLSDYFAKLLELTADVARNATFPQDELDLRKSNRVEELKLQLSSSDTVASQKLFHVVFGAHPYSSMLPTPESIGSLTREDLIAHRNKLLSPQGAVLIVVGAIPAEAKTLALIQQYFGDWKGSAIPPAPTGKLPEPTRSITLVDRPGSAQVDIAMGHLSPIRTNQEYFPLIVASSVLGGGASSRLFNNVREKQGFAYSVYSHNTPYRDSSIFRVTTQVRDEVLAPAVKSIFSEMERLASEPVPAAELSATKNYMNGNFVMGMTTQNGVATQLANVKVNNLPADYLETFVTRIRSVEPDQIRAIAKKYLNPADTTIVMVGDAAKIQNAAESIGPVKVEKAQ